MFDLQSATVWGEVDHNELKTYHNLGTTTEGGLRNDNTGHCTYIDSEFSIYNSK